MSDMLIRIDTEKAIADIEARLGMLYEKAPDVMRKSLNDTAKKTGRELAKLAQERYQIKTIKFAKEFKYTYASKSRLEAVLTSSGEMLAASKFKISPTKPSTSKEGSPPVKLAVLASESPKTITNSRGGGKGPEQRGHETAGGGRPESVYYHVPIRAHRHCAAARRGTPPRQKAAFACRSPHDGKRGSESRGGGPCIRNPAA